jgi:hypothetical protein
MSTLKITYNNTAINIIPGIDSKIIKRFEEESPKLDVLIAQKLHPKRTK